MSAYYNEIDPFAAQWLRELIKAGHIAPGVVDERSIEDVIPDELAQFTQCHFFAGIGVWSLALRRAGWPDDVPVWTGSCPCQPFSAAGKSGGFDDERHLWPDWYHIIQQCRPNVLFAEQVASTDGLAWLDLVLSDLEGANYSVGYADICSAGAGSANGRQRLYLVADANGKRQPRRTKQNLEAKQPGKQASRRSDTGRCGADALPSSIAVVGADGIGRLLEPGVVPLVAGYPGLLGQLRAYGNSINAQAAQSFIEAYIETTLSREA